MKLKANLTLPWRRFISTTFLACLALIGAAHADEVRYYDVEVIIFESLDPSARQAENWSSDITRQVPNPAVELDQPYPGPIPAQFNPKLTFKTLPASQFQLQNEDKLLTKSNQYRILLHTAWVQPGMDPATALPVHINRSFLAEAPTAQPMTPATPGMPPAGQPALAQSAPTRSVLDGYIKIVLMRYLHADVDLTYTTGLPATAPATVTTPGSTAAPIIALTPPVIYRLNESRKMRSNELHYLDHPVLGVLLLITPYEGKLTPPRPTSR